MLKTQNIHGGLTLVQIEEAKAYRSGLWLVKHGETVLGYLEKYKNTKTDHHPWKAYAGRGLHARFLGAFYEPRDGWAVESESNMGGKNGAIDAIVKANG